MPLSIRNGITYPFSSGLGGLKPENQDDGFLTESSEIYDNSELHVNAELFSNDN